MPLYRCFKVVVEISEMDPLTWALLLVTVAVFWMYLRRKAAINAMLPPGTMGFPIIGETPDFIKNRNIWIEERRKKYGKVYKTHLFGSATIMINDAEIAWDVLQQEGTLAVVKVPASLRKILGRFSVTNFHGHEHVQHRKWLSKIFEKSAMDTYIPTLIRVIDSSIRSWTKCGEPVVNMTSEIQKLVSHAASQVMAGIEDDVKCTKLVSLIEFITKNVLILPINLPGFTFWKVMHAVDEIKVILKDQFHVRDISQSGTVLDCLRKNQNLKEPVPSNENLCGSLLELFISSNLTLKSGLSTMLMQLCKYPDMKKKIQDEIEILGEDWNLNDVSLRRFPYTNAFVKETLRIIPPAGGIFRKLIKPLKTEKYLIPEGWTLLLNIRCIQAHPSSVENPGEFRPDRWLDDTVTVNKKENIPFGGGRRLCIGKGYAETFMLLFLMKMAKCNLTESSGLHIEQFAPVALPSEKFSINFGKGYL